MKIPIRFLLKGIFLFLLAATFSLNIQISWAQTISATNGGSPCSNCVPPGWVDTGGTPDISNNTTAAAAGTGGGGAQWVDSPGSTTNIVLSNPPNNHFDWLSLRDLGSGGIEESVTTSVAGLTVGLEYEIIAYSLTAVTETVASGVGPIPYAGTYNDSYTFEIAGSGITTVSPISQNTWETDRLRFVATATSETLILRPGNNAAATGTTQADFDLFETVQVSITVNAVNAVPIADDNEAFTDEDMPVTFDVVSTDMDPDGNVVVSTVDLDPSTPGIQNSISTAQGTWTVDASGNVTFTPNAGFTGEATLDYTIQDDYVQDGTPVPATSNPATLTVTIIPDSDGDGVDDTVDLDDDNDGILDTDELNCSPGFVALGQTFASTANPFTVNNIYPYAGVDVDATFQLQGTTTWASGVNSQTSGGVTGAYINTQPNNTNFPNGNVAVYTYTFSEPVYDVDFKFGGLDNADRVDFIAENGGVQTPVFLSDINLGANVTITGQTAISSAGGANAPANSIAVSIPGPVTTITLTVGKQNGNAGNVTMQFYELDYCVAIDTDNDGTPDLLEVDADNDGCPDALEGAGAFTTGDLTSSNNLADDDEGAVNGVGVPTNAGSPQATTTEVTTATQVNVDATGLVDQTILAPNGTSFAIVATADEATSYTAGTPDYGTPGNANAGINYQWFIGDPTSGGTAITNGGVYTGATTATLNISDVSGLDGTQYCVLISHDDNVCVNEVNCAILTVTTPAPGMELIKSVTGVTAAGAAGALDDVIEYTFTVENT
ncbi:Ig-like domain-containing protein, partial [Sungkyunkwania multivorans]